ncbi:hypothetical protein ACFRKE_03595 [Kitasatospora indigofera]|uniref:hypothetical protein n=1 Tax=Kitasatospora indigofera TaxID=67307 RepID=UPI0036B61270
MPKTLNASCLAGISAAAAAVVLLVAGPASAQSDVSPKPPVACPASLMWDAVADPCH